MENIFTFFNNYSGIIAVLSLVIAMYSAYEARKSRLLNEQENNRNNIIELSISQLKPHLLRFSVQNVATTRPVYLDKVVFGDEIQELEGTLLAKGEETVIGWTGTPSNEDDIILFFHDDIGRKFKKIIHVIPNQHNNHIFSSVARPIIYDFS